MALLLRTACPLVLGARGGSFAVPRLASMSAATATRAGLAGAKVAAPSMTPAFSTSIETTGQRNRVISRARPRRQMGPDFALLKSDVAACMEELKLVAPANTAPDAKAVAALTAAQQTLGGEVVVVRSGQFDMVRVSKDVDAPHPLKGKDAYALLHYFYLDVQQVDQSEYTLGSGRHQEFLDIRAIKQPEDVDFPMIHFLCYQLNENNWPTGVAYSTASHFEVLTTLRTNKKFLQSFEIIRAGNHYATALRLVRWMTSQPGSKLIQVPRTHTHVVSVWSNDRLREAGVEPVEKQGAIELVRAAKKAQEAAKAAGTAAPQAPNAAPNATRQRRSGCSQ